MQTLHTDLQKHAREFRQEIAAGNYDATSAGIFFPRQNAVISGAYTHDVNGQDERTDSNLVTAEGMNYMLGVALYGAPEEGGWFLALFGGNVAPQAGWTAANFATNATEIVSATNGYSEATRRQFVPAAPSAGSISNSASKASFTIASPGTLSVYGGALVSSPNRGAGAGILMSASRFAAVRNLENGDIFNLGYALTLTSA